MPTTPQAYDRTYNGKGDFYLAKLRPDGSLVYGTYLGGSQMEHVETHQLVVDKQGNAIIVAGTTSADFPVYLRPIDVAIFTSLHRHRLALTRKTFSVR